MQVGDSPPVQASLGTRTGSDVGTAGGDLEDDFSVVDASEAANAASSAPGRTSPLALATC